MYHKRSMRVCRWLALRWHRGARNPLGASVYNFSRLPSGVPMRFLLATLALMLAPMTVAQQGDVWVSLASFRSADSAESARAAASQRLPDTVGVVQAETPAGVLYRVVAGPFGTRNAALARLPDIQASGFVDAWLLHTDMPAVRAAPAVLPVASAPAVAEPETGDPARDPYDLADLDLGLDLDLDLDADLPITDLLGLEELDLPDLDLEDVPGLAAPVERDPSIKPTEEPAFEAPADYRLHKLKRGG
ncbi:MAG: SPOR domain-containing protein [Gammaproteobacteria bacterium]|nr:SPOR domain-containing protein [Gammaproteobacteria bacterium]